MTLEETYIKIASSEELRSRYAAITDADSLEDLLEELGCCGSPKEFMKYVRVKGSTEGELPDAQIEGVTGGIDGKKPPLPPLDW